ncbi:thioredoxin family protein [Burkholderia perseverans]|uniref:thioredoxin family protein n=1 Tax=Burkholderia perseverans TaxID=2615214 RepID=UPI001FEDAE96|nr:thioredoxin family protein [Burkholderia perseverans]
MRPLYRLCTAAIVATASLVVLAAARPAALASTVTRGVEPPATGAAPDFTGIDHWLNGPPQSLAQLRGKVVLVDFWTYTCINCIHTLPYVERWHEKYRAQGLAVIGVHTPEYPFERSTANVRDAVRRFGLTYPVAQDNDYATWRAYGNQYWPAFYLIDKSGNIAYRQFGEGDYEKTEAEIAKLIAQPG